MSAEPPGPTPSARSSARRPRLAGVALAAAAASLAGCPRVPPPDLSRDPATLLAEVRAAQDRVRRVRGSARVRIDAPEVSGAVNEFVAAEKPDRLRLETHDFFGNVAAVLVAEGSRLAFYDARQRLYYRGEATVQNVSRLLPLALPPEELVVVLCGSAPIVAGEPLEVEVRGSHLLLTLRAGATGQQLAVGEGAAVEASRVRQLPPLADVAAAKTAPAYDLEFGGFRRRGAVRFPRNLELSAPAARLRVELAWKEDLELNGAIEPSLFRLAPPRGARVIDLEPGATVPQVELPAARE